MTSRNPIKEELIRQAMAKAAAKNMNLGMLLMVGGVLGTIVSVIATSGSGGGRAWFPCGIIIFGAAMFYKGYTLYTQLEHGQPDKITQRVLNQYTYGVEEPDKTWDCPQCQASNPNTTFACTKCGYQLV